MSSIIELFTDPNVIALIVGIPILLRALAEFLDLVGKLIPGDDFTETASSKLKMFAGYIVKVIGWVGIGNKK